MLQVLLSVLERATRIPIEPGGTGAKVAQLIEADRNRSCAQETSPSRKDRPPLFCVALPSAISKVNAMIPRARTWECGFVLFIQANVFWTGCFLFCGCQREVRRREVRG